MDTAPNEIPACPDDALGTSTTSSSKTTSTSQPPPGQAAGHGHSHEMRLHRRRGGRMLGGVAVGLADYFDVDPVLIRVGFVVLTFVGGLAVPLYLAGWALIPDEGQIIRYKFRVHTEFRSHAGGIANRAAPSIYLHDAISANALRKIFVRSPDTDFLNARVVRRDLGGRCERVVGFQIDHCPDGDAHRPQRIFERLELYEQRWVDALAGFVSIPDRVAKRFDYVIRGNADVRGSVGKHVQDGIQHARHGAKPGDLAGLGPAQAVIVPEQLVRSVDQVNDHIAAF